ncbi:LPD3 domain-containing protein [Campylobacter jejuni]|uniref:LPD3 domain-containing protein n=1 Tax=Campylobacter jejuni TaxID=197 RepID=UPI001A9D6CD3|nr:hypothetical protein [Campylobacter jejuni]EKK0827447.1 hypothetical protein [Campylobacter jejuni]MCW1317993.1 hypothetical protein [Campylobacter jejuni]MCW1321101.1 hypothetical protein [Campylobacter jejuni]MCW1345426.1 hypothetical protein [Campylobacter jejuni]MCW1347473.1 hypothetical protein [Campylobacter jejuni]
MNIREFLLEKPQENNIISFLQDGASQSENQNTNEYLASLKNEAINDFYKNKDKYAKEYEKYNIKDQNLTNPLGYIGEYKRDLYDYNKNPSMNADDLSNYILDKQSKFNASKPIFADDNEVVRKSNQFMRDLGDELQKSGRGRLLQDDDGSYWVQDNNGNYSKVQGSTMGDLYRGLRDNGASMALGTAGAIGGTMLGGGVGMVAGGALGASLGAGYDYYGNTKDTNQDMNLKEALMLMGENAGLSLIGDAAFAGVAKGARVLKNTYNMTKSGAQAGKDMIDGMAVKGGNLKENIGDKLRKISPSILNDLASQGSETSKAYARELIESENRNYDDILQKSRAMPLEVNQGNALVDGVASKIKDFSNTAKNGFVKNTADNVTNSLNNISKNIGSKEAALNQQDLINLSFMNDDLANMARSVLANDPKMANKVANSLHLQDEAILKELNLNNASKADELYALRDARAKRAYDEFGKGLDKLDELNPNGVKVDKQTIDDIVLNSSVYSESTPAMIKNFIHEAKSGALDGKSVKEIYDRIDAIGNKIKESSSYNYKDFLNSLKDAFLENIVKSADNPQEAKEILTKIRKDYADFKVYDKSKLGKKLEGSEKEISKDIDKILNETNPKKNYEAITKGLNDDEIKVLDNQIITRALEKNKVNIGDANNPKFAVNYKAVMDNFENFKPKSKSGQEKIEVLKTIGDLRTNFETVIDGILNSKAKELGHGISTNFIERAKTMLVNNFTDYIAFYFMRLWEVGKRAGTRIQMRRGFSNINNLKDFDRSAKEFIESIKDKTLKEEAQEARKEFNSKVKDLIEQPNKTILREESKNKLKSILNKDIENSQTKIKARVSTTGLNKMTSDKAIQKSINNGFTLEEHFKAVNNIEGLFKNAKFIMSEADKKGSKDVKAIHRYVANLNNSQAKITLKESYEHGHRIYSLELEELSPLPKPNAHPKENKAEVENINSQGGKDVRNTTSLFSKNSTQAKPKKNLMDDIKENIKNKEVKKKNKKSVKQRLDEKIQNDKKASEERIEKIKQVIARKQRIDKVTDKKIAGKIGTYTLKNLIKLKERSEDK